MWILICVKMKRKKKCIVGAVQFAMESPAGRLHEQQFYWSCTNVTAAPLKCESSTKKVSKVKYIVCVCHFLRAHRFAFLQQIDIFKIFSFIHFNLFHSVRLLNFIGNRFGCLFVWIVVFHWNSYECWIFLRFFRQHCEYMFARWSVSNNKIDTNIAWNYNVCIQFGF